MQKQYESAESTANENAILNFFFKTVFVLFYKKIHHLIKNDDAANSTEICVIVDVEFL
jgi:hypothetical protein